MIVMTLGTVVIGSTFVMAGNALRKIHRMEFGIQEALHLRSEAYEMRWLGISGCGEILKDSRQRIPRTSEAGNQCVPRFPLVRVSATRVGVHRWIRSSIDLVEYVAVPAITDAWNRQMRRVIKLCERTRRIRSIDASPVTPVVLSLRPVTDQVAFGASARYHAAGQ